MKITKGVCVKVMVEKSCVPITTIQQNNKHHRAKVKSNKEIIAMGVPAVPGSHVNAETVQRALF